MCRVVHKLRLRKGAETSHIWSHGMHRMQLPLLRVRSGHEGSSWPGVLCDQSCSGT